MVESGELKRADEFPVHTVNLDDRTAVAGRSLVTLTGPVRACGECGKLRRELVVLLRELCPMNWHASPDVLKAIDRVKALVTPRQRASLDSFLTSGQHSRTRGDPARPEGRDG